MIETKLAQIVAAVLLLIVGRFWGNSKFLLEMSAWCPPDVVTHSGGHLAVIM
jgi:hypothetical protein